MQSIAIIQRDKDRVTSNKWGLLVQQLETLGFKVHNQISPNTSLVIYIDPWVVPKTDLPSILVAIEPQSVNFRTYQENFYSKFTAIFHFGEFQFRHSRVVRFEFPVKFSADIPKYRAYPEDEDLRIGMICANKNSLVRSSQYHLRRKIINKLSSSRLDFKLAGPGWNRHSGRDFISDTRLAVKMIRYKALPYFPYFRLRKARVEASSYIGEIDYKAQIYTRIHIEVCIDNWSDYLSEKIFDTLQHGIAVFYVGDQAERFGIPKDIVLTCPPEPDTVAIKLSNLSIGEINQVRSASDNWIRSVDALRWSEQQVVERMARAITSFVVEICR
jgi:hypothetical protein